MRDTRQRLTEYELHPRVSVKLFLCLIISAPRDVKIIMFLGSKVRRVRRADNLTAISDLIV
jgi:hypothetical protein